MGNERLRLFCALQLSDETIACVTSWQQEHLYGGRIVPSENLHLTLAFLGSRPAEDVEAIAQTLRECAARARVPQLEVVRYRETRSVGMLVLRELDGEHAAAFADDLQHRLEELGVYRREPRAWLPHLTVLRFRERAGLRPPLPNTCSIHVVRSALYRSSPGPASSGNRGVRYHALDTAALGGT